MQYRSTQPTTEARLALALVMLLLNLVYGFCAYALAGNALNPGERVERRPAFTERNDAAQQGAARLDGTLSCENVLNPHALSDANCAIVFTTGGARYQVQGQQAELARALLEQGLNRVRIYGKLENESVRIRAIQAI